MYMCCTCNKCSSNPPPTCAQVVAGDAEVFVEEFLESRVKEKEIKEGLLGQLRLQTLLLDPPCKAPKVTDPHRPPRRLSARKRRVLKLYDIPKDKQR